MHSPYKSAPGARRFAQGAVLGSRIFHCGGLNGQFHHDCHSFDLDSDDNRWEEEAGLVLPRDSFGLSAVGEDTLVASGGRSGPRFSFLCGSFHAGSWLETGAKA